MGEFPRSFCDLGRRVPSFSGSASRKRVRNVCWHPQFRSGFGLGDGGKLMTPRDQPSAWPKEYGPCPSLPHCLILHKASGIHFRYAYAIMIWRSAVGATADAG